MIKIDDKEFLDISETAKLIGISETAVRVRVRAKEAPQPTKLRYVTFWKRSEIEDYINNKGAEK